MSDVVGFVWKITLGLLVKKAQSSLSNKLKDGGVDSQQLRNLVINKLQNLKDNLDGLARAHLLSSVSRVQEGLRLLGDLLDKRNTPTLLLQEDDHDDSARASAKASSNKSKSLPDVDSALKLAQVIDELKRSSGDHFTSAIELFKEANTKATEAFHNEALSIEDRILAAKIRVQSRLLSSLENPCLASQPCRLYLEELHGLAPIVKDFQKHLERGKVSVLNSEKRRELVLSVSAINLVVFKFLKSFTKDPINLYDWPNLTSDDWTYNPLIPDKTICIELQSAGIEFPNLFVCEKLARHITISSEGCLIGISSKHLVKHTAINNETLKVRGESAPPSMRLRSLAIGSSDITYLLLDLDHLPGSVGLTEPYYVDAANANDYFNRNAPFRPTAFGATLPEDFPDLKSTPDGFALVRKDGEVIYYKNNQGAIERTCSFQIRLWVESLTTVTSKYQLVAVEMCGYLVRVYKEDGQLMREFELYGGKDESCVSIAFNHLTEEVVFVSSVGRWFYLSTYELETGKRRHKARLTLFGECRKSKFSETPIGILKCSSGYPKLTAHCSGPMAVVSKKYALRLQ